MQSPQDYVEQVTATTGMPFSNVTPQHAKVHGVLSKVEEVLRGLTRGLDLSVLDAGIRIGARPDAQLLSAHRRARRRAAEQFAGVHSLWAPATVLKMPLVLKPGSAEPWTPLRIIHAWVEAGAPAERVWLLPHRSRRRQRNPALVRARHGVRRRRLDQALEVGCRASRCTVRATARS